MATSWAEEGALADMKYRLDRLRIHQSKQKSFDEEEEPEKVDTLKLLQSKFGSMVYDPTSPMQRAYERRCARTGRRKSIEFEDLYLSKGSGQLRHHALPNPSRPSTPSSSTSTPQRPNRSSLGASGPAQRTRKSSDPAQYYRKQGLPLPPPLSDLGPTRTGRQGQGQEGPGQGHPRGPGAAATLSEEDRKLVDQRLSKISSSASGLEDSGRDSSSSIPPTPPLATAAAQQRRRKISSPSKFPTGKH